MVFLPTMEETMLRDSARRALAEPSGDGDRWQTFAGLGWLMATLPEEVGGLGWGPRAAAIIAEEIGRADCMEPYTEVGVVAQHLLLVLGDKGAAAIGDGASRPVFAHNEAAARGAPDWIETRAERTADGYRLTGAKHAIVAAREADRLLISALTDQGPAIFDVDPAQIRQRDYALVDGRSASDLLLSDTLVPESAIVGRPGAASEAIASAFDHALVIGSAEALGTMQRAFDLTREYLMTRKQYGQLIGSFQALRHRLADMFIEMELARSMVVIAVAALADSDAAGRARLASAAKARVAQAGLFVTAQAIQLHGGIGVTEEYPVGRLFTRMTVFNQRFGAADAHVGRFAALSG